MGATTGDDMCRADIQSPNRRRLPIGSRALESRRPRARRAHPSIDRSTSTERLVRRARDDDDDARALSVDRIRN